ncbi:MAG TPA: LysR family transcriptional regulator [Jatrophihabitantaceae bacterium]|jgi:DNA-binding transcriptional LysR family regulator|nr:LysR family transcriptional regulator [Jatrophihabitantaceae bacterium]
MSNGEAALDVGRLRLLREVSLRGSIAAAARSLGLTPSAVSQQLSVLEREAGTSLIDRSPRGVSLTGAGHALVVRADEVLDVLAAARADLDRMGGVVSGPVAVASVASAAATFVSAAVGHLADAHPGIALSITAVEPVAALDLLLAGDVDVAIVDEYDYVPLALPDFVSARELCAEPLVLVRPESDRGKRVPALAELADAAWVMPPEDAACGQAVRSACRAAGFEPDVRWQTDDMLLLARAVGAGHGVAVLPRFSVPSGVAPIVATPLRSPALRRRLTAAARSATLARPVVAIVVEALARAAQEAVAGA